ncbi:MAG: MazG-like family protein [Eubacteriales bacterium]|uniref:MazG-like family protein n=1 Tax=Fenollaria sp. TaxID=1965292 RepID=UPI002A747712|nr:MazG-like family protein [Fenollaria sp.]MDD7339771.1 MazG-like family protein [Eubacteriales bacterium]MDY3106333.1 MazG-like family protein [Fenollaria sp.]
MTINELNAHIIDWAKERELDTKGTVEAQSIKTVEELSELIKAICKDKKEDIIDSIGDVYVTLVIGNMLDEHEDLEKIYYYADDDDNTRIDFDKEDIINNLGISICHIVEVKRVTYSEIQLYEILQNLLITTHMYDLDFTECVESAYNTIKNRKGITKDGTFYKA